MLKRLHWRNLKCNTSTLFVNSPINAPDETTSGALPLNEEAASETQSLILSLQLVVVVVVVVDVVVMVVVVDVIVMVVAVVVVVEVVPVVVVLASNP